MKGNLKRRSEDDHFDVVVKSVKITVKYVMLKMIVISGGRGDYDYDSWPWGSL